MKQLTFLVLLLSAMVLSGCGKQDLGLTTQEQIELCNLCMDSGLICYPRENYMGHLVKIDCLPTTHNQDD